MSDPTAEAVVTALWWEVQPVRRALHRLAGVTRCDVVVVLGPLRLGPGAVGPGPPTVRLDVRGECPCRDYLVDMLVESDRFLHRGPAPRTNPAGAVRHHVRTRAAGDWTRRRRVAMGAQARTDRIRSSVRARALPDELHRALLEYVVDEAGSLAPLDGEEQLCRRLAARIADEFGGTAHDRMVQVRGALPLVEAVGRTGPTFDRGDGHRLTWWERYVEEPLGRRSRRGDVPLDPDVDLPVGVGPPVGTTEVGSEVGSDLAEALRNEYADRGPERSRRGAVRDAVLALVRSGVLPRDVGRAVASDPQRLAEIVAVLEDWPVPRSGWVANGWGTGAEAPHMPCVREDSLR
jgi:hypothetical protein